MRHLDQNWNGWLYYENLLLKIMTLFLNIYIIIYSISLSAVFYFFKISGLVKVSSLSSLLSNINTFNKLKSPILTLLVSLSGLPPFFLFFIKFNILTYILFTLNPIISFFVFLVLFLNMLYYIQIFFFKNSVLSIHKKSIKKQYVNYNIVFNIYLFIFGLIFSIFFTSDISYILNLL